MEYGGVIMTENSITIRFAILLGLLEGREPMPKDVGMAVSPEEFNTEVQRMEHEGIIANVKYARGAHDEVLVVFLKEAVVTPRGNTYIDELMKRYS